MSDDEHEVYAIRYGHHDRKASENFIGGDPHDMLQPLDFYVGPSSDHHPGPSSSIPASTPPWARSASAR